jgi:pimeloyl-ACP methyl ester carboxylesterase
VKQIQHRSAARHAVSSTRMSPPVTVHLRKMYVDCRFGQMHVHTAFPSNGGFDERVPLVCVHSSPSTGRAFRTIGAELGQDRSVYAPDLPGYGESEAPESAPSIAEYAAAVGDLLDTLRLREVDLLAHQSGSFVAAELAVSRPMQVRRVILASVPMLDAREREAFHQRPWPGRPRDDGSHLAEEWQRLKSSRGTHVTMTRVGQLLAESLEAGEAAGWGPTAAADYPAGERLPLLRQHTLVLRPHDEYWDMTARAEALLPEARCIELPAQDGGLLDAGVPEVIRYVREFLDR